MHIWPAILISLPKCGHEKYLPLTSKYMCPAASAVGVHGLLGLTPGCGTMTTAGCVTLAGGERQVLVVLLYWRLNGH